MKTAKKSILTITVALFIAATVIFSCKSSSEKVEDAQNKVEEAQEELNQVLVDSIQQYKRDSQQKITALDKDIAEFKTKIATAKIDSKAKYERQLAKLEQKSSDLKKKLEEYKDDSQDNWTIFKNEFNHDMDELGKAFKDLTVNNIK